MSGDKGLNGQLWMEKQVAMAREAFQRHELTVVGPGHWRIKRPGESTFWTDIVVMGNVGLSVWGDIDGCFFAYYSGAKRPEALVYWLANADPCYYGRQKAHIGMSSHELVDEYVDDVAVYDLHQRLECAPEEYGEDGWKDVKKRYTDAIEDAIRMTQRGEPIELVHRELYDNLQDIDADAWEWLPSIGRVTSLRVIYALAAIRRLSELLDDEREGGE